VAPLVWLLACIYCEAVGNVIIIVVCGVILQNGKQVVAPCMLLVDRSQELDACRCHRVMQCGRCPSGSACWWGGKLCALVRITLGDGPSVGTLGSGMAGDPGHSTLADGVSVAIGFDVPWWRIGQRIAHSF
jgi:hypothetical protein